MIKIERRPAVPGWLRVTTPIAGLIVALIIVAIVMAVSHVNPLATFGKMFSAAFTNQGALTATFVDATPLLFTGLCAVVSFRMRVYNIGGEGQLYAGAIVTLLVALLLAGQPAIIVVPAMIAAGIVAGALWVLIPALLRSYLGTNEILTTLMLNYVAGLLMFYLIFDSHSYLRDLTSAAGKVYPQSKTIDTGSWWPSWSVGGVTIPLGLVIAIVLAIGVSVMFNSTRLGFKIRVTAESPVAARYAGFKVNRLVLFVLLFSGMLAGLGGASQVGDFSHILDPTGLEAAQYGYTGIVVAALGAFGPLAVIPSGIFLGAILNSSVALNGQGFPQGLVGIIEGIIIFCVVSAAMFTTYRVQIRGRSGKTGGAPTAPTPTVAVLTAAQIYEDTDPVDAESTAPPSAAARPTDTTEGAVR